MYKIWQFYCPAITAMPRILLQFGHVIHTLLFLGGIGLTIAGCHWSEMGPLWGVALLGCITLSGFLQAVYEHHAKIVASLMPIQSGEERQFFVGTWDNEQMRGAFHFVLQPDGTAQRRTEKGVVETHGQWSCDYGEARITWDDGGAAILRHTPSGQVWRLPYPKGLPDIPNGASIAIRIEATKG
jgi:hypothetical protein